jgi:hypothetical protein
MNFRNTILLINDKKYSKQIIQIGSHEWIRYNAKNADGDKFSTYILDWKYSDAK